MALHVVDVEPEIGIGAGVVNVKRRDAPRRGEAGTGDEQIEQSGEVIGVAMGEEDGVDLGEASTHEEVDTFAGIKNCADLRQVEPSGEECFRETAEEHGGGMMECWSRRSVGVLE